MFSFQMLYKLHYMEYHNNCYHLFMNTNLLIKNLENLQFCCMINFIIQFETNTVLYHSLTDAVWS